MSVLFTKTEWLVPIVGFLIAVVTYAVQKWVDKRKQVDDTRRTEYIRYFSAISAKHHYQTVKTDDTDREYITKLHLEALLEMRKSVLTLAVISSDEVYKRLATFHSRVSLGSGEKDPEGFLDSLFKLIDAIRNEGFGKSRLSKDEILALVGRI